MEPWQRRKVLIGGGGLAGLAAAKRLLDAGHEVVLLEKRAVLGGKWSSWQDEDGDWLETGLHVFFGAYDEIFTLMREIGVYDHILWKDHVLTYTLDEGERFDFRTSPLPSPFHLVPTLLKNKYFTWPQKLSLIRNLVPILFGGQGYYDEMDKMSYAQWHLEHGISEKMLKKMFLPVALALKFVGPEDISAKIVLDVSGMFLRENTASKMGFLMGSPEQHLVGPLAKYVTDHGGKIEMAAKIISVETDDQSDISGFCVQQGDGVPELMTADEYVLALPIHNLKRLIPARWKSDPYFDGLMRIEGVPVVSVHLWADRQISFVDNILFSPDGVIPVYADMANTTPEYRTADDSGKLATRKSRFQFCVAPAFDLINQDDNEIVGAVWSSIQRSFPDTAKDARIEKVKIVRIPQSVYWPKPGIDKYRVPQQSPVANLFLAGGYTIQRFYDSMEGAVRSGNRAADALLAKTRGEKWKPKP